MGYSDYNCVPDNDLKELQWLISKHRKYNQTSRIRYQKKTYIELRNSITNAAIWYQRLKKLWILHVFVNFVLTVKMCRSFWIMIIMDKKKTIIFNTDFASFSIQFFIKYVTFLRKLLVPLFKLKTIHRIGNRIKVAIVSFSNRTGVVS